MKKSISFYILSMADAGILQLRHEKFLADTAGDSLDGQHAVFLLIDGQFHVLPLEKAAHP